MNSTGMIGMLMGVFVLLGVSIAWADEPDAAAGADGGGVSSEATDPGVDGPVGEQADRQKPETQEDEDLKRRWYAALAVLAVGTAAIFLSMFLLALLRASRRYRRRLLGEKAKPTEYVDAWSQYRLKEDYDEPDEDER